VTRAVGVDLGERRIGIAVSDSQGVLASPYAVVERSGDPDRDRQALADIVADVRGEIVVVGLPLSLSGAAGPAARAAADEALALESVVGVPVETFDERLTTVEAERRRRERAGGGSSGRGGGRGGGGAGPRASGRPSARRGGVQPRGAAARAGIDAEAAAVMLGAWLEARPR
jgi:putative Holliday junction resolvase